MKKNHSMHNSNGNSGGNNSVSVGSNSISGNNNGNYSRNNNTSGLSHSMFDPCFILNSYLVYPFISNYDD